jgi:Polysaccharide pyruvyl transferase
MCIFLLKKRNFFSKCFGKETELLQNEYEIYLFPFCTDNSELSDDRIINRDVYQKMSQFGTMENVHLIETKPEMNELLTVFRSFHATVCSRFHAHIFSFIAKTPMLSIYTTRKVGSLIDSIGIEEYSIKMDTNSKDFPIDLDNIQLIDKWNLLETNYTTYKEKLTAVCEYNIQKMNDFEVLFSNLLFYRFECVRNSKSLNKSKSIISRIIYKYNLPIDLEDVNVSTPGVLNDLFNKHYNLPKKELVDIISYTLTQKQESIYSWGLNKQIYSDSYSLTDSAEWIIKDHTNLTITDETEKLYMNRVPQSIRRFNTQIINSNLLKGYHRSGWNYVLQNIDQLHNPDGVLFDCYLDKTFGWESKFLSEIGIVPYTKSWVGVFHHTTNTEYSDNNLVSVFKNPHFFTSLQYCKGIIVFSMYIKKWITSQLGDEFNMIPVMFLYHPSEIIDEHFCFDIHRYKHNKHKKVIQIGGWLRNSYAIYALPKPTKHNKCVLKWHGMNNYFINDSDIESIESQLAYVGRSEEYCCGLHVPSCPPTNPKTINKYIVGLLDVIKTNHESVECLSMTPNDKYDCLLMENVIFINLVDAAAVNTIIECIIRSTPICVNKLPSVVEYLGEEYPMYYDTLEEASKMISDYQIVKRAHYYLKNLDKSKFTIKYFMHQLTASDLYKNLA